MVKIAVDLLGSDNSLEEIVKGLYKASLIDCDIELIAFGPKEEVEELLKENGYKGSNVKIFDANYGIKSLDNYFLELKTNKNASMAQALRYIRDNDDVDCFVTTGTTGALVTGAMLYLKPLELDGVKSSPCLAACLPNSSGRYFCILDCGATTEVKSSDLVTFAKLGSAFIKAYQGTESPRVGLISNGSEESKGNQLTKEAFQLLKELKINFVGNIEGNKITEDSCDVLVCDGFSGNIVLKNIEGTAKMLIKDLFREAKKAEIRGDIQTMDVLMKTISNLMSKYDFNSLGGSTLLGVNKIVVKGHGAATSDTIVNIVKQAYVMKKNDYLGLIYNK